ncbi:MAG: phosphoglycerate mutase family protein [Minisyncoccia bacterium]
MEITNKTSHPLIAFTWDTKHGYGKDYLLEPEETKEIVGPYIGEMGGGHCRLVQPGEIVCQSTPDDDNGFHVSKGKKLNLQADTSGVTVRHYSEDRESHEIPAKDPLDKINPIDRKIFLLRHASYVNNDSLNPVLSSSGKEQASNLARKIKAELNKFSGSIVIWTSPAQRANETAQIIKQELQSAEIVEKEKLWEDSYHCNKDFLWLEKSLNCFYGEVLIIISHQDYVNDFPETIEFRRNNASYAQGVLIHKGECHNF